MDQIMLDVLERACASRGYIAVNTDDPGIYHAIVVLQRRGLILVDMALHIRVTSAGIDALAAYHDAMKQASRQKAEEDTKTKRQSSRGLFVAILAAVIGVAGAIIAALIARA